LQPLHLKSLVSGFERSPYARYWLQWAQTGQLFITVLAVLGLIIAVALGWPVGAAMAMVLLLIWVWLLRILAWGVAIRLSAHFADFVTSKGIEPTAGRSTVPPQQVYSNPRPRQRAREWCALRGEKLPGMNEEATDDAAK